MALLKVRLFHCFGYGFRFMHHQLGRYFGVALASTLVDVAISQLLVGFPRMAYGLGLALTSAAGVIAGLTVSFFLSRRFVFTDARGSLMPQLARFFLVALVVWLVRFPVVMVVHQLVKNSVWQPQLYVLLPENIYGDQGAVRIGLLVAIAVSFIVSFLGHKFFSFRSSSIE